MAAVNGLLDMYATCESGLEDVLAGELSVQGATEVETGLRGVSFRGDREVMWRANVWSRTANRVLLRLASFRVRGRDDLYGAVAALPWSRWLDPIATIAVDTTGGGGRRVIARQLANQVVKDAICDRLRQETGRRPSVDRFDPDVPFNLLLHGHEATLSLDTSGRRLHRRGYRTEAGTAPLKETLAAGMLLLAGYDGTQPLIDPLCGSGTIAIEAALIARGIAPGLLRLGTDGFAFQRWREYDSTAFEAFAADQRSCALEAAPAPIHGRDIDRRLVAVAARNARRASVGDDIDFDRRDVASATAPGKRALLVSNPPYGERLSADLDALYRAIGDTMKRELAGGSAWLLVADKGLAGKVGLKPARRIPLFNGRIECRLLRFDLWEGRRDRVQQPD